TEDRRELAVEFDGDHAAGALQQLLRQRAAAGADFDHRVLGRRAEGVGDAAEQARVGQEVLAEALLGPRQSLRHQTAPRCARLTNAATRPRPGRRAAWRGPYALPPART